MAFKESLGNVWGKAKSGTMAVSLEAKKKMKESSIKGEISSLEAKMNGVFTQIGREAYESLSGALAQNEKTKELSDSLGEIKDQIAAKEKELEDEMARFDKEIAEVKGPQKAGETAPTEEPKAEEQDEQPKEEGQGESKKICTNCGAPNSPEVAFCGSCGAKMEK